MRKRESGEAQSTSHRVRRCVVCGDRSPKGSLLRFVCGESGPQFDRAQRAPGRGMYVHPRMQCWTRLAELKLWQRALKLEQKSVPPQKIREAMDQARSVIPDLPEDVGPARRRIKMI